MNRNLLSIIICTIFIGLITLGFQCGSSDFSGAKVYIQHKQYDKAIELLEKETKNNPNNEEAWYLLGKLDAEKNDFNGMNIAFNNALKVSKEHAGDIAIERLHYWGLYLNEGFLLYKRGSSDSLEYFNQAISKYKMAVTVKPDTSLTYEYLAHAYFGKGDIDSAIIAFTKIWELDKDADSYKQVGKIYLSRGLDKENKFQTDNADKLRMDKSLKSIRKGGYKSDVMRSLGAPDIARKDKKNPKNEEWEYIKYNLKLSIEGEKITNKVTTKQYNPGIDSTEYYRAVEDFNKAIAVLTEVRAKYPKDNETLNLILQAYVHANRIQEATIAFEQAVADEPGNKTNHYILGVLYRTIGDFTKALNEYRLALQVDPTFTDASYEIGATLYNWGVDLYKTSQEKGDESTEYKQKFQDALPYLEKVSEDRKDDVNVWQTLGTIYARLGQTDKAVKALDQVDKLRNQGK